MGKCQNEISLTLSWESEAKDSDGTFFAQGRWPRRDPIYLRSVINMRERERERNFLANERETQSNFLKHFFF